MCLLFSYRTYSKLEKANKKILKILPDTVRFPTDQEMKPIHPWSLYSLAYYHISDEDRDKCIDFPTPIFKNLRWMLETHDYPDGGPWSIVFLGLVRGVSKKVILVGDWEGQAFNLSRCIEYKIFEELIPKHLKKLEVIESNYNKDSILVQSYCAMVDASIKHKNDFKPLAEIKLKN